MNKNQKKNLLIQVGHTHSFLKKLLSITIFFRKTKTKIYQIHDSIILDKQQTKLDKQQSEIDNYQERIKRARILAKKYQTPN